MINRRQALLGSASCALASTAARADEKPIVVMTSYYG
jgi:hypothetical protein